jgi:hypothetical protein
MDACIKAGVSYICYARPHSTRWLDLVVAAKNDRLHGRHVLAAPYNQAVTSLGTKPKDGLFTGMAAIVDLVQFPIASLCIIGMDFYSSGSWKSKRSVIWQRKHAMGGHRADLQLRLLKRLVAAHPVIKPDRVLRTRLSEVKDK